jgi:hypothetical protein
MDQAAQSGTAMYFRIVPVPNEAQEAEQAFMNDGAVFTLVNGATKEVFGTPKTIQTNMEGYNTTIVLPFEDISEEQLADPAFLDTLGIYVEHDDGTTELIYGTVVYRNDEPFGIQFEISKFSRFQIVSVKETAQSPWLLISVCAGGILLAALVIMLLIISRKRKAQFVK